MATDAQLLRLHHYETRFGIHDHDTDTSQDPLALIAMRPAEVTGQLWLERTKEYEERKIKDRYGLSLNEFLEYPREMVNHLVRVSIKRQGEDLEDQEAQVRKLADAAGENRDRD